MKPAFSITLGCTMTVLATTSACAPNVDPIVIDNAVIAAESWLAVIDAGNYTQSWEQSAVMFQSAVTPEKWEQSLNAAREPLGGLLNRHVQSTRYATSLPGAPDGEYVVIQFKTEFAQKKSATETVTPMKEPDGQWRVSGYYIK